MRLLIEVGAESRCRSKRRAQHGAAPKGHLQVVQLLIRADKSGAAAVCFASFRGNVKVVRLLLEAGAGKDVVVEDRLTAV